MKLRTINYDEMASQKFHLYSKCDNISSKFSLTLVYLASKPPKNLQMLSLCKNIAN